MTILKKFLPPDQKQNINHTDNSLEFMHACEDLCKNHVYVNTPYRSETKGIAENAVVKVKAGASALLVQSGL